MWITLKPENEKPSTTRDLKCHNDFFFLINDVKLPEGLCTQDGIPLKGGHGLNVDE